MMEDVCEKTPSALLRRGAVDFDLLRPFETAAGEQFRPIIADRTEKDRR
jgi:hypothetical protein